MFRDIGTDNQVALTQEARERCDFPFERLLPELAREADRDEVIITWADLTKARTDDFRATLLKPVAQLYDSYVRHHEAQPRHRVLGEAWTDGVVRIDYSCETDPELAVEVVLSELAHIVDFFYLTPEMREAIWDVYHPEESNIGDHSHGWFDIGGYETWVGESFMAGFTRAYSNARITLTQFVHATTDEVARKIRHVVTPELGVPPWDTPPLEPDPGPEPTPEPEPKPEPEPEAPSPWQRFLRWIERLLWGY